MYLTIKAEVLDNANLKPQEVYLLMQLIKLADKDNELTMSSNELMAETRFTNRSMLIRYLDTLVENNYIERILGGGGGIKNTYKINKNIIKCEK